MIWIQPIFVALNILLVLFFLHFAQTSIYEKKWRAFYLSLISASLFGVMIFVFKIIPYPVLIAYCGSAVLIVLLYFLPIGKMKSLKIGTILEKVDERDIIFSREDYRPGSNKYEQYYSEHPDKREGDDKIRILPELLEPGGKLYNEYESGKVGSIFRTIENMLDRVDGEVDSTKLNVTPDTISPAIKKMVLRMGADEVGVARLNPMYVYSHVGRGPDKWGEPIINKHKNVIVFTMEMDYRQVEQAPGCGITHESAFQYLRGANLSIALAEHIRSLGYPARAHIAGSNYQIMLPPVAYDAGLGELGRIGYLISPRFGARIRLGAVSTDLPLNIDQPINFGVQDFCAKCLKCAVNCPSAAISKKGVESVKEVMKWPLNIEKCIYYWRMIGTDCGLCMKVCPYSHPRTLVHNLVRSGISRSKFAQQVSLWGDDLFYGRKIKGRIF